MAEKVLNTRIMLKYDSYENCNTYNPILKKGEVIFSAITTNQDGVQNAPSILIKVGDGAHAYKDLKFVSALAADVIAACKSESALTTFINNVIVGAGIATDEAISALSERMSTVEGDIASLQDLVGNTAIATQIQNAIDALDLSDTYDAKGAAAQALADAKSYADSLNTNIGTRMTTVEGKLTTLIGTDADKSVRTIANEELAAQLIPESAKESLDTLSEIAAWIQSHPDDASAMNAAIEALQTKVGSTSVSAQISAAIDALKAGDIKSAVDRISALEADTHTHENKTELDKIASGDKAKWDAAVQTITASTGLTATKTGTDVAIGIDDTVTWVFDCGNASV